MQLLEGGKGGGEGEERGESSRNRSLIPEMNSGLGVRPQPRGTARSLFVRVGACVRVSARAFS